MLVFSTKLPLQNNMTQEQCLELFFKWIAGSKYYDVEMSDFDKYDKSSHKDFDFKNNRVKILIRHYKDDNIELSAGRLISYEIKEIWTTDCIFYDENGNKYVLIQTSRDRSGYNERKTDPKRPFILKTLVQNGYCRNDAGVPVGKDSLSAEKYYSFCRDAMLGKSKNCIPVVYISSKYTRRFETQRAELVEDYVPNLAKDLSYELGGVAHVFLEETRDTANRLRIDTNNKNVHNGTIGVYFPGAQKPYKFRMDDSDDNYNDVKNKIITFIWDALSEHLSSLNKYTWEHIISLQYSQKLDKKENLHDKEFKEFYEEYETLREERNGWQAECEKVKKELKEKKKELSKINAKLQNNSWNKNKAAAKSENAFYRLGNDKELCEGEANDMLFNILSYVKDKYPTESHAYAMIESMLEANPRIGKMSKILEETERILGRAHKLTKAEITSLEGLGFVVTSDGAHHKMLLNEDARYQFSVSKTPSDSQSGGENLMSEIRRKLDVERKIK